MRIRRPKADPAAPWISTIAPARSPPRQIGRPLYRVPRSWAERAYPNLVHYSRHDRGGHFAAWEQPQLLSGDVRATFRRLR